MSPNTWGQPSVGQANVIVDSTTFLIGDPLEVQIIVNVPKGNQITFPATQSILEEEGFEVYEVEKQDIIPGDVNTTFKQVVTLTAWEPKSYQIPTFVFPYKRGGQRLEIKSTPVMLQAIAPQVTGDTAYVADIKPIMAEQANFWDKLIAFFTHPVVMALLLLLLLAAVIYGIIYYRNNQDKWEKPLSPEEVALQKLDALMTEKLLDEGDFKSYHTQISFILREYLGNRFGVRALETPISYFLPQLVNHDYLRSSLFTELKTVLEHADLIKFAKASPLDVANEKAKSLSYALIHHVQECLAKEAAEAEAAKN